MGKYFHVAVLIAALAISGCVNEEVPETTDDGIIFSSVELLPSSQIYRGTGMEVKLAGQIENKQQDERVQNVKISLRDWCPDIFDIKGGCIEQKTDKNDDICVADFGEMRAGELKSFSFVLAQKERPVEGIEERCELKMTLGYSFSSWTDFYISVISDDEQERLEKAGGVSRRSADTEQSKSPVKINVDIGSQVPLESGSSLPFVMKVRNVRDGYMFPEGVMKGENLKIILPDGISSPDGDTLCGGIFKKNGDYWSIAKGSEIPITGSYSDPIYCILKVPDIYDAPEQTFKIRIVADFVYEIERTETVRIKPLK